MVPSVTVGGDFDSSSTKMEDTLRYVLRALDGCSYDQILVEKTTCLVSLANVGTQVSSISSGTCRACGRGG